MSLTGAEPTAISAHRPRAAVIGTSVLLAVLAAAVVIALATGDGTPSSRRAVAFTAAVCGVGAVTGWLISRWPCRNPATAVAAGLTAVCFRIATPLVALAWLQTGGQALRAAGANLLLVGFYLALLATDVVLNVLWAEKRAASRGATLPN
ncbi:MAG: hypothetical protein O3A37_12640 [Planctomycetota bacterium]|jgi:hypothetical protein|nr:hypothetical protein [Planctomycetota bacterium]